jgi:CHASE2 domain-containing sensor protein
VKRLLALALLCPLVAACGGTSRLSAEAYEAKLATIATQADKAQHDVERALQAKTAAAIHTHLSAFATADDQLGGQIAALKPPTNAEQANTALAKAEHDMAATVRSLLPRVAQANSAKAALALLQNNKQAAAAGHELDTALGQLKKLGYTKGS